MTNDSSSDYPVQFRVEYPDGQRARGSVLVVAGMVALLVAVISWIAILVTGQQPKWAFEFLEGLMRWGWRVTAYAFLLTTDRYPPFSL